MRGWGKLLIIKLDYIMIEGGRGPVVNAAVNVGPPVEFVFRFFFARTDGRHDGAPTDTAVNSDFPVAHSGPLVVGPVNTI
ncbi:hypothetical protein TSUD_389260 [Trifolium subterraneum]|uniref:Uncharacterized protein n=1 Tax=Trifolium subterraneum TaxID=3900 RepID=A0A2Z6MVB7_TRISU|nr:hypothetical protein TSUD_389260 [Trifolium subterraneum]